MEGGREQTDLFFRKIKITLKLRWKGNRFTRITMENLKWNGEGKCRVGEMRNNLFQDGEENR